MSPQGRVPVPVFPELPDGAPEGAEVVRVERFVPGGTALGRTAGGEVRLVPGALPDETVVVVPGRSGKGPVVRLERVLQPAAERRTPACAHVADGCGGCDFQHAPEGLQRAAKVEMVVDALRRQGGVPAEELEGVVGLGPELPATGFRSVLRCAVSHGRPGLRHRLSHDVVTLDSCLVAHPLVEQVAVHGRFPRAEEVTIRAGLRTGEVLVLADPSAEGSEVPEGVRAVGADEVLAGTRAWIFEVVAGRRWRISARSFFQTRPDGAEALLDVVDAGVGAHLGSGATLVDLCAGVGLFAGGLVDRHPGLRAVAVEPGGDAVADARVNLADLDVRVVRAPMARWHPVHADVVVADPPRAGLGAAGVRRAVGTGAKAVALVSCDAASMGRDVGLLRAAGYRLVSATLVDLFPQTTHLEVVSILTR